MTVTDDATLVMKRLFKASAPQVFDAWLSREEWQSWIGPEGVDCDVSLLEPWVGGSYRLKMHMTGGGAIAVAGIFKVVDRPHTLSFTWGAEGDPARQSLITLSFAERDGKTELTLRQDGLGSAANCDQHRAGWSSALNKLERLLARERSR